MQLGGGMADVGGHKRPAEDAVGNGGALVEVHKKARHDGELVLSSKRPDVKQKARASVRQARWKAQHRRLPEKHERATAVAAVAGSGRQM